MIYIFDTNSLEELLGFFPDVFVELWKKVNDDVREGRIISVQECYQELQRKKLRNETAQSWLKEHESMFQAPNEAETTFMQEELFVKKNGHFKGLIERKKLIKGDLCADPFIIAKAKTSNYTVVSEESEKPNSAKIPNVCKYFKITCYKLEKFMKEMEWQF